MAADAHSNVKQRQLALFATRVLSQVFNKQHPNWIKEVYDYLCRIFVPTAGNVDEVVVITALLYSRNAHQMLPTCLYPGGCEMGLVVSSLMLADAFINDNAYSCKSWALVSGIGVKTLIQMRRSLLTVFQHDLYVSAECYSQWSATISLMLNASQSASCTCLRLGVSLAAISNRIDYQQSNHYCCLANKPLIY